MLDEKYLERLGIMVSDLDKKDNPLLIGKYVQKLYQFLLSEQERDLREEKNK